MSAACRLQSATEALDDNLPSTTTLLSTFSSPERHPPSSSPSSPERHPWPTPTLQQRSSVAKKYHNHTNSPYTPLHRHLLLFSWKTSFLINNSTAKVFCRWKSIHTPLPLLFPSSTASCPQYLHSEEEGDVCPKEAGLNNSPDQWPSPLWKKDASGSTRNSRRRKKTLFWRKMRKWSTFEKTLRRKWMSTVSSSRGKIWLDFAIWLAHQILTWRGNTFYQVLMMLWMSYSVSRYPIWLKLLSFTNSSSQILVIHIEQWYNCSIVHGRSIQRFIPHGLPLRRS